MKKVSIIHKLKQKSKKNWREKPAQNSFADTQSKMCVLGVFDALFIAYI